MNRFSTFAYVGCISIFGLFCQGCSMSPMDVRAEGGRPEASEVSVISLPYDSSKPKFVLVVEPFQSSQSVLTITHGEAGSVPLGDKMASQLITALSGVKNFIIYDKRAANKISLKKGEKGPYLVSATLTEFNENAEGAAESNGGSLGQAGAVTGIAGAITGNRSLTWTGAGIAAANPTYESDHTMKKGMVAFDVKIVDKKTGRIISSFEASGTFKAESQGKNISLFGIGSKQSQFASSAIGQALRMAMNDAVMKSVDSLS